MEEVAEQNATLALPHYIKRDIRPEDASDYQTIYARAEGAVAAPTAGLHFTPGLMAALAANGIEQTHLTLHVGAGTFLPVKTERIEDHCMHPEFGEISAETAADINRARSQGRCRSRRIRSCARWPCLAALFFRAPA